MSFGDKVIKLLKDDIREFIPFVIYLGQKDYLQHFKAWNAKHVVCIVPHRELNECSQQLIL